MSQILTNVHVNISKSLSPLKKYKKDIELASKMLLSVKNISHGLFLQQGGFYNQCMYDHLIIDLNAQTTLIHDKCCFQDLNHAKK